MMKVSNTGATLINGGLRSDEVAELRRSIESVFDSVSEGVLGPLTLMQSGLAELILVDTGLLSRLVSTFPGVKVFPNICIRRDPAVGWHFDQGLTYVAPESCRGVIYQAATYLQTNGKNGGGIDIIPNSHHGEYWNDNADVIAMLNLARRTSSEVLTIPSEAGDIAVWDGRLLHRSTPNESDATTLRRYSIQFTLSDQSDQERSFIEYLIWRSEQEIRSQGPMAKRYKETAELARGLGAEKLRGMLLRSGTDLLTLRDT